MNITENGFIIGTQSVNLTKTLNIDWVAFE